MSWGLQKRNNAVSYTTTPVNYIVVVNERERKLGHRFSCFAQKAFFSSYFEFLQFFIYYTANVWGHFTVGLWFDKLKTLDKHSYCDNSPNCQEKLRS